MRLQYWMLIPLAAVVGMTAASAAVTKPQTNAPAPTVNAANKGSVSREAFRANSGTEFDRIDANKDGKLSKAEIEQNRRAVWLAQAKARNSALFKQLDLDHNGSLSADEFAHLIGQPPAFDAQPIITRMDTNHDGQVSREEFLAAEVADFDRLDTNKDGIVTRAEIDASRAKKANPGTR
ncbi:MAG TPA: EF-hand domain-containing protein [Croceibacterium sp.]|nr:EF-hand domain-containing protein [Croceibacterium sp.]